MICKEKPVEAIVPQVFYLINLIIFSVSIYSTVTDLARFLGLSTSSPLARLT